MTVIGLAKRKAMKTPKNFAVLIFLFGILLGDTSGQVCGYVHARFFVTDNAGSLIRDAQFEFRDAHSDGLGLHRPFALAWQEEEGSFFLREGMCGGHEGIRLIIRAPGFKALEHIIDLPLNRPAQPQLFRIMLVRTGGPEPGVFQFLSKLTGRIMDSAGAMVPGAVVTATSPDGNLFTSVSDSKGEYELTLPYNRIDYQTQSSFRPGRYDLRVESPGFHPFAIIDVIFIDSQFGEMRLDFALEIMPISDHSACGYSGADCDLHEPVQLETPREQPTKVIAPQKIDKDKPARPSL
jgi:hypothetical protein